MKKGWFFIVPVLCMAMAACNLLGDKKEEPSSEPVSYSPALFDTPNVAYLKFKTLQCPLEDTQISKIFENHETVQSFKYDPISGVSRVTFKKGARVNFEHFVQWAKKLRQRIVEVNVDFVVSIEWVTNPLKQEEMLPGLVIPETGESFFLAGGYDNRSRSNNIQLQQNLKTRGKFIARVVGTLHKIGDVANGISVNWYRIKGVRGK